jgi:hypothetical protein
MDGHLGRMVGDAKVEGSTKIFLLLQLVNEEDNLAILRAVLGGTPCEESLSLATAYCATHPGADKSPDDPGHVRDILEAYSPGQAYLSPCASSWGDMVTHWLAYLGAGELAPVERIE